MQVRCVDVDDRLFLDDAVERVRDIRSDLVFGVDKGLFGLRCGCPRRSQLKKRESAHIERVVGPDLRGILAEHLLLRNTDCGVSSAVIRAFPERILQCAVDRRISDRTLLRERMLGGASGREFQRYRRVVI